MASYSYRLIQLVPDPARDERMNVGVLVYSGEALLYRFESDLERVGNFFGSGIVDLFPMYKSLFEAISFEVDRVSVIAENMRNHPLRLTEPRVLLFEGSLEEVLLDLIGRYVRV